MGLVRGFVLQVNRRALLAILAVGISVSYALVAGAAVGGLEEAQGALAGQLSDTDLVANLPDEQPFEPTKPEPAPNHLVAKHEAQPGTIYTVRWTDVGFDNASRAYAGSESRWQAGENVTIAGENRTVTIVEPPRGASGSWLGVSDEVFVEAGGPEEKVHLAVYDEPSSGLKDGLEEQGFEVHEAPATFPYYTQGALQLVSAVSVTVLASALVVALLTSTIVSLELRAKRSSFATLQVYASNNRVRRLVAGRGVALLVAGHLVGLAVTLGALFLVGRAGAAQLSLDPSFVGFALTGTFGGGLLGLIRPVSKAGQPLTASELGGADEPWDLPSPLRLTLASWRTLVPLAISAMILAASLGVIFGAVDMPSQLFGTDDANVIADTSNNPLRGTAPAFLGTHLGAVDGYAASSPEIYAPTTIDGEPVMARGVSWDNLVEMDPVALERGTPPDEPGEAVLGERLAKSTGADVGDRLRVPASYRAHVETLTITGVASAPGLLGDELLVHLDSARDLAGVEPGKVNLVRYRVAPGSGLNATDDLRIPNGIEAHDLTIEPRRPIPLQEATAKVSLVNFADAQRRHQLTLRVNGEPVTDRFVTLDGHETGSAELDFRVPSSGLFNVQVNPSRNVQTGDPAYRLDVPDIALNGSSLDVEVTRESDGEPAEGVQVSLPETSDTTDADGVATLEPTEIGNRTIAAEGPEGRGATTIVVVRPEDQYGHRLIYKEINGPTEIDSGQPWSGTATVENVGGQAFDGVAQIPVDNGTRNASQANLLSGERQRIEFSLDLEEGRHTIGEGQAAVDVLVGDPGSGSGDGTDGNESTDGDQAGGGGQSSSSGGDSGDDGSSGQADQGSRADSGDIRELLKARAKRGTDPDTEAKESQPIEAFLADTFENFNTAVTVVVIATVLHAGLIGVVAVRRDVEEHADNLAAMASVGADRRDLRGRALKEFAIVGGLATAIGVAAGLGLVWGAAELAWIKGFGHALVPRTSIGFALRVAAVSMVVILGSVVLAVEQVRGRSIGDLFTEGPERPARPPLEKLIGGSK